MTHCSCATTQSRRRYHDRRAPPERHFGTEVQSNEHSDSPDSNFTRCESLLCDVGT